MSLNTNQILQDLTTKPICLSRQIKNAKDDATRIKFNVACIPKAATNATQARCLLNIYNITVAPDIDCGVITTNGWANTFAQIDAKKSDCLASCSVVAAPNITKTPVSNSTTLNGNSAQGKSMAMSTAFPNFIVTFGALLFVFSVMFSRRHLF